MQNFENLHVWRKAHALVCEIYRSTSDSSPDDWFELRSQLHEVRRMLIGLIERVTPE